MSRRLPGESKAITHAVLKGLRGRPRGTAREVYEAAARIKVPGTDPPYYPFDSINSRESAVETTRSRLDDFVERGLARKWKDGGYTRYELVDEEGQREFGRI